MNKSTNAACSHDGDNRGALSTSSSKSNVDSGVAFMEEYARKNDPSSARAMPTEPMSRYFQVASSERGLWLKYSMGAVANVAASIATHIRPRWCDRTTSVIAASMRKRLAQTTRFG